MTTHKVSEDGIVNHLLSTYDNFYADLSGMSGYNALNRDKVYAKKFLIKNASKLLYGTDNFQLGLKQLLDSLNLSVDVYNRIYKENALNLVQN